MDLEVRNLSVAIGGKTIIHDVSAEVKSKRFVGIVGPNGSGKSTTLKTIYRVLKPHSGTVLLDGKALEEVSLKESARRLGVMTQMSTLNFDFRVEEVVLMGRTPPQEADGDRQRRGLCISLEGAGAGWNGGNGQPQIQHALRRRTPAGFDGAGPHPAAGGFDPG